MNTSKLQPANPDILEGVDDLTKLSYLNEPSVLHDLEYRYLKDQIYVSANPSEPTVYIRHEQGLSCSTGVPMYEIVSS